MNWMRRWLVPSAVSVPPAFALAVFAATHATYTWPLFLGVPLLMGFLAVLADKDHAVRASMPPLVFSCVLLLAWKIEGAICLAMAAPLAIPLALLGGYIGSHVFGKTRETIVSSCLVALVPFGVLTAHRGPTPETFRVSSQIVVNAPPEVVWKFVYAFPDLKPPTELIFRAGVAAPLGSSMVDLRAGADRSCKLSTGIMRERVTVWDPPRRLAFDVLSTPPSMKEISFYKDLDPPHLHGFYLGKRGEFRLQPLPGGRTLLIGTSWYQHGLQPAIYWRLWSDYVVHKVHERVLGHVKRLAEAEPAALRSELYPQPGPPRR